jgi:putative component of toxin-antitoxin plasmid stabilization module
MTLLRKLVPPSLALFMTTMATALMGAPASASCGSLEPLEQAALADSVFVGEVLRLDEKPTYADFPNSLDPGFRVFQAILRVETVFKGRVFEIQPVGTSGPSSTEFRFDRGGIYTVFAHRSDDVISTSCGSGTTLGAINPKDFGLDVGTPPRKGVGQSMPRGTGLALPLGIVFFVGLGTIPLSMGFLLFRMYRWGKARVQ